MQKLDPTSKQIMSYCLGLRLQNPELRGLDLEPSPKRDSNKINMQKQGRNMQKKIKSYYIAWTYIWIPALREVDLKPSSKRVNSTRALVSLY